MEVFEKNKIRLIWTFAYISFTVVFIYMGCKQLH